MENVTDEDDDGCSPPAAGAVDDAEVDDAAEGDDDFSGTHGDPEATEELELDGNRAMGGVGGGGTAICTVTARGNEDEDDDGPPGIADSTGECRRSE